MPECTSATVALPDRGASAALRLDRTPGIAYAPCSDHTGTRCWLGAVGVFGCDSLPAVGDGLSEHPDDRAAFLAPRNRRSAFGPRARAVAAPARCRRGRGIHGRHH